MRKNLKRSEKKFDKIVLTEKKFDIVVLTEKDNFWWS